MVFTWVSTGVVEPYIPPPPIYQRVPSTHPSQKTSVADTDTSNLDIPSNPSLSPSAQRQINAYQENSRIVTEGDKIQFVYQIMSKNVDSMDQYETLEDAKRKFREKRYRHIPILDNNKQLVGILSDRDILRIIADEIPLESILKGYMVTKVLTAEPDTTIREVANVMLNQKIGCLPILTSSLELTGIVTRSDILKAITKNPPLQLFA
jgi:acetoin utilization protein AcuB